MIDRTTGLAVLFGLLGLACGLQCPKQRISPGREVVCYTSVSNVEQLTEAVCKCTTLIQQGYDVRNLSISDFKDFRLSLKEINPVLQFAISVDDPGKTLRTSGTVRQEIIARLMGILPEVDAVELNMTAGSKERLSHFVMGLKNELVRKSYDKRVFLVLPTKSEDLAKYFDLKELSKYVDLFTVPTHYLVEDDAAYRTFHPSRLMGLFDMFNADSLIDLISGLGAPKRKILVSVPASGYKFTLKDRDDNAPRAATELSQPVIIDQKQLCELLKNGEWTVERDEDLTGPYAFKDNTWIAFEDKISVSIKGKYALLRELPGLAIHGIENDFKTDCGKPLVHEIHHSFSYFKRKSRSAVLNELESDLHQMELEYPTKVKSSDFRVVRVVDTEGLIRVVRENTQTEFTCARQGYFVHPKSCNRFYRCVKFNQEVEDYSVFEFDCPAGLSFDERTEVCVWPGSMPEGSPCPGSSEIAPVARVRFECPPKPGYYADPQNPRWFFACIDLGSPEMMAYEFRCPYGLIFDEQKLICEWPWLVEGYSGTSYTRSEYDNGYGGTGSTPGTGGYYTGNLPHGYTGTTAGGVYSGSTGGSGYSSGGSGFSGSAGVGYSGGHGSSFGQATTGAGYSGSGAAGRGSSFGQGTSGSGYSGSGGAGAGHGTSFGQGTTGTGYSGAGRGSSFGQGTSGSGYSGAGGAGAGHGTSFGQGATGSGYSGTGASGAGHGSSFGQGKIGSGYSGSGAGGAGRGSSFGQETTGSGYSGSGGAGADHGSSFGQGTTGSGYSGSGAGGAGRETSFGQGTTGSGYSGSGGAGADHGSSFGQGKTGSGYSGTGGTGTGHGSSFGQGTTGSGYSGSGAGGAGRGTSFGQGTIGSGYSGSGVGGTGAGHGSSFDQGTTGSGYSGSGGAGESGGSSFGQGTTGSGYSGSGAGGAGRGTSFGQGTIGSGYSGSGAGGTGAGHGSSFGQGTTGSGYSGSGGAGADHGSSFGQGTTGSGYSGSGAGGAGRGTSFGQGTIGSGYSGSGAGGTGAGHGSSFGQGTTGSGYSGSGGAGADHGSSFDQGTTGSGYSGSGAGGASYGLSIGQGTTGTGYSGSGAIGQGSVGFGTGDHGSAYGGQGSTGYTGTSGSGSVAAGHGISYSGQGSTTYSGTTGNSYSGSGVAGQVSSHGQGTTGYSGSSGAVYTGSGHFGSTVGVHAGSQSTGYSRVPGTEQAPTGLGHTGTGGSESSSVAGHDYSGQGIIGHGTSSTAGEYPGSSGPGSGYYSGSSGKGQAGSTSQSGIGGQPGTGGTYGGFQGTTYTGSVGVSAGATSGVHVGASGSTVGYAGSTAGTHITVTEGYGGSDVKGGRYPGSSGARYPGSYPSSTARPVGTDYSGPGSVGYPEQTGTKYTGSQTGSHIPGQVITYGGIHPSQTTTYISSGVTGNGVEPTGVTSVHGQTRGPVLLDKPNPPKCITACSGTTIPSGGQTYVTNVYQGTTGYSGSLNISLPGGQVPSIGSPTYHGAVTPSYGYGIPTGSDAGAIVTGHGIPGSIITGDSTPSTIITYGNSPGSVISGATDQGSIVTGGSHPGYTKTGSGTPGYTIIGGTKTIYPGSASPGTAVYGTPSPGVVLTGAPEAGTITTGQSSPGIILTGQTAPGVSIGGSTGQGTIVGSTGQGVFTGSAYQPQHGSVSPNIPYGTKIGPGSSTYDKTPGYKTNEYHDNGGRGTIKFNNGDVTTKYTENDIPDYRPTGGTIPPDTLIPGHKIVPGASGPSGFTKTGPTKTGFTTATLGAGGSYVINTGHTHPTPNSDHIGPKAFEGNVAGYTKSSTESVAKVYPTYDQDVTHVDTSKITLGDSRNTGYSYPTPNIPFENGVTKHLPIASTEPSIVGPSTPTPFLNVEVYNTRRPGDSTFIGSPGLTDGYQRPSGFTKAPGVYTTRPLEDYKTTLFQAAKIPVGISTGHPSIDTAYKTISSSTPLSVTLSHDVHDGYDIQTGSEFGFGTKAQQSGYQKGYVSSTTPSSIIGGATPTYSAKPQFDYGPTTASPGSTYYGSSSKFGQSVSGSPKPQTQYQPSYSTSPGVGVTYGRPVPDETYQYSTPVPPVTSKTYIGAQTVSGGADYSKTQSSSIPSFQEGYRSSTPASPGKTQSPFAVTTYSGGYSKPSTVISHQSTATSTAVGKPKVIVKWSDLHPLLLGKLGAECTCRGDPFADLKIPSSITSSKGKIDLLNYDASDIYVDLDSGSYEMTDYDSTSRYESSTRLPQKIWNSKIPELTDSSSSKIPERLSSTYLPSVAPSVNLAVKGGASSNRGLSGNYRTGKSLSDSGTNTDSVESRSSSIDWSETDDETDLTLDGATNCARPGLFRHPNFCNKFYACHWDEWKKKFTLHVFNCPVHLTFDNGVAACNWPSMGPACQDDNLLV